MEEGETLELVSAYAVMFTPAVLVHNLFTAVLWLKTVINWSLADTTHWNW